MKKYLLSVIAITVTGALVSCNNNEIDNRVDNDRTEVKFSSNIVNVNKLKTRMANNEWAKNDTIGIFMFEQAKNEVVENMDNVKYMTQSEGTTGQFSPTTTTIFFPDNGDLVRFMSYYPYTAAISNYVYKVDVSDQTTQAAIDLLHSFNATTYSKVSTEKKVPLTFKHKLTKVNINVKHGEGLLENDLQNIKIHIEGLNTEADFDLLTATLSGFGNMDNITPIVIETVQNYAISYQAIIIPTEDPSTAKIVFDLDNGDEESNINSDVFTWFFSDDELEEGTEYTYNVTVKRSGIVVEATINEWIDGGANNIEAE